MTSTMTQAVSDERLCIDRAMQHWEASMKRPDLSERDRVRGAIEAFSRQMLANELLALRSATPEPTGPFNLERFLQDDSGLPGAPTSTEAGREIREALTKAQDILAEYIVPDSGISDRDCINALLGVLDHRDLIVAQRRAALSPGAQGHE